MVEATDIKGMLTAEFDALKRNPETRNLPIETLIQMSKAAASEKARDKSAEARKETLKQNHTSSQERLMNEEREMSRRGIDPSNIHRKAIEKVTGTQPMFLRSAIPSP